MVYRKPPDGGWGWVIVIVSFFTQFLCYGSPLAVGVLYLEWLDAFGEGKGKTAWVGSLANGIGLLARKPWIIGQESLKSKYFQRAALDLVERDWMDPCSYAYQNVCKSLPSIQVRHVIGKVSPDPQFSRERRTFGVPLEALTKDATQCGVPFLVTQLVEYLEVFGLRRVGIFRISGSVSKIKELKQKYNQGEKVDLINHGDVDSVASLLKLFLNELPVAVLPDNVCAGMLKTFQEHRIDTTECIKNLRQLISRLPQAHQNLLQFLSAFLLKVATYSAVNCMTLENLAIVFGPALFKIPVSPLACEEQRLYNGLLLYLLQHYELLFVDVNPCFSPRQADGLQARIV